MRINTQVYELISMYNFSTSLMVFMVKNPIK